MSGKEQYVEGLCGCTGGMLGGVAIICDLPDDHTGDHWGWSLTEVDEVMKYGGGLKNPTAKAERLSWPSVSPTSAKRIADIAGNHRITAVVDGPLGAVVCQCREHFYSRSDHEIHVINEIAKQFNFVPRGIR